MNNIPRDIARLIFKYRWENLSDTERVQLGDWVLKSAGNRKMFENLLQDKTNYEAWNELERYDSQRAFQKFVYRAGRYRKFKYIGAGVAAVLVLGFLIGKWYGVREEQATEKLFVENMLSSEEIQDVVLTLDNGQKLSLGLVSTDSLLKGRNIRVDSACMTYAENVHSEKIEYNSLEVPAGGEYGLLLSDGTHVYINSQSKLTYPTVFCGEERVVELDGEAYFDVKKDPMHPFWVKMGDVSLKVLGTSFNVKAYRDDIRVETTLVSGSVEVRVGEEDVLLSPGQQLCYNRQKASWIKRDVDVSLYTSWKEGTLKFERERLEDILNVLGRWYGMDIFYSQQSLKEQVFSGNLRRYKSVGEVLEVLKMTSDVHFIVKDKIIIVE